MRHVVIGGAGFVGSHLVDALVLQGKETIIIDDFSAGRFDGQLNNAAVYHEVDMRNQKSLQEIFKQGDVVYLLAAVVSVARSVDDPVYAHDVNVNGALAVLETARHGHVARVVVMSSAAVYGDTAIPPVVEETSLRALSPYGLHKIINEQQAQLFNELYGVPTTILRPFNIFGPRQRGDSSYAGVIARFFDDLRHGKDLTIEGDGAQTRDFVYVLDVVRALIVAGEHPAAIGQVFNVGGGHGISIKRVAEVMVAMYGGAASIRHVNPRRGDIRDSVAAIDRIHTHLGWVPQIPLEEGLYLTMNYSESE